MPGRLTVLSRWAFILGTRILPTPSFKAAVCDAMVVLNVAHAWLAALSERKVILIKPAGGGYALDVVDSYRRKFPSM